MSFASLRDHTVRFWEEATPQNRDASGGVRSGYTPVTGPVLAKFTWHDHDLESAGSGDQVRGDAVVSTLPADAIEVERRQLVQLVSGPEAPAVFRVVSVTRPRGHHMKAIVESFEQVTPDELIDPEES